MPFYPLFLPFHCHLFLQRETITTSQAYAADLSSRLALLEKEKVEAEVKARSAKDDMMKMKADVDREQRRAERANDEMMYIDAFLLNNLYYFFVNSESEKCWCLFNEPSVSSVFIVIVVPGR